MSSSHPVPLLSNCKQVLSQLTILLDRLIPLSGHAGQLCLQPLNLSVELTLQLALLILDCEKRPGQAPQTTLQAPIGLHQGIHSTHSCAITVLVLICTPL